MAPSTVTAIHLSEIKSDLILLPNFVSVKRGREEHLTQDNTLGKKFKTSNINFKVDSESLIDDSFYLKEEYLVEESLSVATSVLNSPSQEFDFDIDSIISTPSTPFQISDKKLSVSDEETKEKVTSDCDSSSENEISTFLSDLENSTEDTQIVTNFKEQPEIDSFSLPSIKLLCMIDVDGSQETSQLEPSEAYIKAVSYLIDSYSASILGQLDSNGLGIIHHLAIEGLTKVFKYLEEEGYDKHFSILDVQGNTPLHLAVQSRRLDLVAYLLDKGLNPSQRSLSGESPVRIALESGDIKVFGQLLTKVTHINEQDQQGKTLLHCACSLGRKDAVEMLLRNGASSTKKDCTGVTPAMTYVMSGHHESLSMLMKDKSSMHLTDVNGRTVLHWAAAVGNVGAADFLLSMGAKIESRDKKGRTPFLLASFSNHFDMVKYLKDKNANKDVKDNEGREAIFHSLM